MQFSLRHLILLVTVAGATLAIGRLFPVPTLVLVGIATVILLLGGAVGWFVLPTRRGAVEGGLFALAYCYAFTGVGVVIASILIPVPIAALIVLALFVLFGIGIGGWTGGISARQTLHRKIPR